MDTRVGEVLRRCPENWSRCSSGGEEEEEEEEEAVDELERDAVRAWAKPPPLGWWSPVVDLINERSPDGSSKDRKS